MIKLYGIGVSPGIASAPALVVDTTMPELADRPVAATDWQVEIERLDRALGEVKDNLRNLERRTAERAGPEEAKIFEAQVMMIEDEDFMGKVRRLITQNHVAAERAFEFVALEQRELWLESNNPILVQRVEDVSDVLNRVLRRLVGQKEVVEAITSREPRIVVIKELTAGLTVEFDSERVSAFVTEEGTRTSHAAILARSLGIPTVMGVSGALSQICDKCEILVDGGAGTVAVSPEAAEVEHAHRREGALQSLDRELDETVGKPAVTPDGRRLELRGNLDLPEELDAAVAAGAEGIGLVRTEFLVLGRSKMPDEEVQYQYFRKLGERFDDRAVVVRSYDLGGDKFPHAFRPARDPNPFLGWRAIRVCLDHPDLFISQIRAVLRARAHGNVQLMLPLITGLEEVEASRELVAQASAQLRSEGLQAAEDLPVGVMIETPAAVMLADELAQSCDFLSVGTNDLTQYTLAVDRGNARLANRFEPMHPALLRMLARTREAAAAHGTPLSVCGELASDPLGALLLTGLGYDVLSVAPTGLKRARWLVRHIDSELAREAAARALECAHQDEVYRILTEALTSRVDVMWLESGRLPQRISQTTFRR